MAKVLPMSVAIPAYGRRQVLLKTLEKIAQCDPLPAEVLIHADGGWDPCLEPDSVPGLKLRVLHSQLQLGPGGGRDAMLRAAEHDLVASFDDDSWPLDGDYFAKAEAVMMAFPNALVLSPAVYLEEKPLLGCLEEVIDDRSFEGSASVHRRSLYLKLPGYVPVPDAYGVEEADLSLQAHATGMQLLSSPWLRAWHDRPNADYKHSVMPWIRNEVLLGFLRFPHFMQPWAWWRAVRHVLSHRHHTPIKELLAGLAGSLVHCTDYENYRHRYPAVAVLRHYLSEPQRWVLRTDGAALLGLEKPGPGRRVVYLQYTNPGSYPPLEHSSQILARRGWEVTFLGLRERLRVGLAFPPHPRITVESLPMCPPGPAQKLHYLFFTLWCFWKVLRLRADWVYASDPLSAPIARGLAMLGHQVIFHEHDSPTIKESAKLDAMSRLLTSQRTKLARSARAVVLPNAQRLEVFVKETGATAKTFCVWNCSSLNEVPGTREPAPEGAPLRVLYHGSINPQRFPKTFLSALKLCGQGVVLRLVGYETLGSLGYVNELRAEAVRLGVNGQFETIGPMHRYELMQRCGECDVGLSLLNIHGEDINMLHMTGASNKPFDYLARGLALIVPPDPRWEEMFVKNGCAKSCPMDDDEALARTFAWFRDHRSEALQMGRIGQKLVREGWNYEAQFKPVLELMESNDGRSDA